MQNHHARTIATPLAGILCAAFAADIAIGQCQYEVTAIIQGPPCPPFGNPTVLYGRGMNSHGHVTGFHRHCSLSGHDYGFFWTPQTGRVTMHKPPGAWQVWANDINDNGLIAGTMQITGVGQRGFVYDRHTQQYIALLEPLHGVGGSSISAINESGFAVGQRSIGKPGQSPNPFNAVIWDTNTGEVIDLGVGDGPNSAATDVKAHHVVGWVGTHFVSNDARAWLWGDGRSYALGILPGTLMSTASNTNVHKDVIGACRTPAGHFLAFRWSSGTMYELAPPSGFDRVGITDITDSQQIYGRLRITGTSQHRPYIWQHGEFHMLDDLLVPLDGFTLSYASLGIADGRILADGGTLAAILVPIDQPIGDLNHDCRVDVHDLQILLGAWGPVPRAKRQTGSPADLNGDGVVDVSDLLTLLTNWTGE